MTLPTCPDWCIRRHDPVDDFHTSAKDEWVASRTVNGEHPTVQVYVERHIAQDGTEGRDIVVIEGPLSECLDLAEFARPDVERLVAALTDFLEVIR